ncbi:hypothetical protein XZ90_003067 [Salmonella enterica subsp. enterica]|nr:hypothetical protein [Salmonella enterica subsp. enterica serovar Litchfield]EDV1959529.1 hypothetical protein [Salmonella enterica subsp. enterica serovar Litchfield]
MAQRYLKDLVLSLDSQRIIHASYGSYAVIEALNEKGESCFYHVPFRAFRERKKLRIHVTSAYAVDSRPGGGKVGFFVIANKLLAGKPLPHP